MRPEAGHSMMARRSSTPGRATRTMRRALPDRRTARPQCTLGHAYGAIEHPGRNLERPRYVRAVQRAAENAIGPLGRAVNENVAPEPGMKPIKNLSAHRPVGVLKPCCTTRSDGNSAPWPNRQQSPLPSRSSCSPRQPLLGDQERRCGSRPSRYRGQQNTLLNGLLFQIRADPIGLCGRAPAHYPMLENPSADESG